MDEELKERVKRIAQIAYVNDLWSLHACFNFMNCYFTEEQVESWENVMAIAVRAKNNGGIKEIRI